MQHALADCRATHSASHTSGTASPGLAMQVQSLEGTQYDWLLQLLDAFHRGDMAGYDTLCQKHADVLNAMPSLVEHERLLKEKITIMCLLELIFRCQPFICGQAWALGLWPRPGKLPVLCCPAGLWVW